MPTRFKGTPEEVRALDAFIKLMRAANSLSSRLQEGLSAAGLTEPQFAALEALFHIGPMNASDLARKLLRSGPNLTVVLDNLEAAGLVERVRCSEDRRRIFVHLTPTGQQRIAEVFPGHAARVAGAFATLEPSEQEELARLTRKLGRAAARMPE